VLPISDAAQTGGGADAAVHAPQGRDGAGEGERGVFVVITIIAMLILMAAGVVFIFTIRPVGLGQLGGELRRRSRPATARGERGRVQ
jgi:hypothetical protein